MTTQKRELKKLRIPATWCFVMGFFLCLNLAAWCQTSTVVIAEVMYDHPLYDNEVTKTGHEGEFMSLYNYGEDDVDISGWRIEITDLMASNPSKYSYRIPSRVVLPESGLAVIASHATNGTFDILRFYGTEMPEESEGYLLLYTSDLAFPDTRTRIRLYDAQSKLQDELIYDGNTKTLLDTLILQAENKFILGRPLSETVSIQREKIIEEEGLRIISRADYFAPDPELTVKLFSYLPEDYSYTAPSSILSAGVPDDLTLSGTTTGTNDHRTKTITSTQIIESGTTDYWAEEEIVLGPGFEVKEGAEFVAGVERDSVHLVKMMTYNLWGNHTEYKKHAQVVKNANPDVVAVQEVKKTHKFKILKDESGYEGKKCMTTWGYGIGLLYKSSTVGEPTKVNRRLVTTNDNLFIEDFRGFIVAKFRDFCFVSTHLSLKEEGRKQMANRILENSLVKECQKEGKPIYIAGDLNEGPKYKDSPQKAIPIFEANGFEILNDTVNEDHITFPGKSAYIDLIFEYNENPYHKTIDRGIPIPQEKRDTWINSDHFPYFVKLKVK